jgi:cytochrome c
MRALIVTLALIVGSVGIGVTVLQRQHRTKVLSDAAQLARGDPHHGKEQIAALGCVACHVVPGFSGTKPRVGPPLVDVAERTFIAGVIENTPDGLIRFIRDPRSVAPKSAMPKLPMTEQDARDIAAYLYTLH